MEALSVCWLGAIPANVVKYNLIYLESRQQRVTRPQHHYLPIPKVNEWCTRRGRHRQWLRAGVEVRRQLG